MNSDEVATRFKHWVTWRIVAELMRRHKHHLDLRIYEIYPGGSLSDTLALTGGGRRVCDFFGFRRINHHVELHSSLERSGGYVLPYLKAEDPKTVVDDIERTVNLPKIVGKLPVSCPTTKTIRVMADILTIALTTRDSHQWRSADRDHSGGEAGPRESFLQFEHIARQVDETMSIRRFWILFSSPDHKDTPRMIVDLAGRVWFGAGMMKEEDVSTLMRNRGGAAEAAMWLFSRANK